MIDRLIDDMVVSSAMVQGVRTFKDRMLPFLRTITHRDVLSSLILETPLDTIYTFLFGPNGRRALKMLTSIASALNTLAWEELSEDENLALAAIIATFAVLEKIIELNQTAQLIEEFTPIVEKLAGCVPEELSYAGSRQLSRIRQRLGLGTSMPLYQGHFSAQTCRRPVFHLDQDLPGRLSDLGPRHENDHADIRHIKIMPTTEEI